MYEFIFKENKMILPFFVVTDHRNQWFSGLGRIEAIKLDDNAKVQIEFPWDRCQIEHCQRILPTQLQVFLGSLRRIFRAGKFCNSHLNRDQIESNLSVPAIQGCHENALYKR